jgi:hypothetical protein
LLECIVKILGGPSFAFFAKGGFSMLSTYLSYSSNIGTCR